MSFSPDLNRNKTRQLAWLLARLLLLIGTQAACAQPGGTAGQATSGAQQPDQARYAEQPTPIYADAGHTQTLGMLTPGTKLYLENPNAPAQGAFFLDGWTQQGNDTAVFLQQGKRTLAASMNGKGWRFQKLGEIKDDYDNLWTHIRLNGYVDTKTLTASQDTVWHAAITLYSARCSACHALHKPTEFTANQWPGILEIMAKNAALQPPEKALITQYLQTHAKP
ncbi:hypothetical protein CCAE64S_02393 [Castellaniella caeni]